MTKILVVEDEAIVAKDIRATLTRLGYAVPAIASMGEEALARATEMSPDLVLMDIHLKGRMDGIETAGRIRESMDIPVVYLSAYADDSTIDRARATEPYGYLVKPFNERELRGVIEIALYKHEAEARQRARSRRLEHTLKALEDAVVTADIYGRVTHLNPAAERLTGWPLEEAVGQLLVEVCHIALEEGGASTVERADSATERRVTSVLLNRQGQPITVEEGVASLLDDAGAIVGLVVLLRDVTEARQAQERVAMVDRLASLGAMVGGISHDINNPLSYVIANIDYALEQLALLDAGDAALLGASPGLSSRAARLREIRASLADAAEGAQRIREVVVGLRSFSQPSDTGRCELELAAVFRAATAVARASVERRARLHVEIGELPRVVGNEARLVQAFANFLSGAADTIAEGNPDGHLVRMDAWTDGRGRAVIEVRDTGTPVDAPDRRSLFDAFFIYRGSRMGSGLGLWIAHRVIAEHGGEIRVESTPGLGNHFTITLPGQAAASADKSIPCPSAPPRPVAAPLTLPPSTKRAAPT